MSIFSKDKTFMMRVQCSDFKAQYINMDKIYEFDGLQLCWAIITLGLKSEQLLLEIDDNKRNEIMSKLYLLKSSLNAYKFSTDSKPNHFWLKKSEIFTKNERSEKSNISYYQGMFFAKLFGELILNFPYMVFLDSKYFPCIFDTHTKKRPDLIAYNPQKNLYGIFEAKGRSGNFDLKALNEAKNQIKAVKSINGATDFLGVACESFFDKNDIMHFKIQDPESGMQGEEIDAHLLIFEYYFNIFSVIKCSKEKSIDYFDNPATTIDGKLKIGMPRDIYSSIEDTVNKVKNETDNYYERLDRLRQIDVPSRWISSITETRQAVQDKVTRLKEEKQVYVGYDGISVEII